MDLKDKVAVITGAGSGLGKALAETFAKEGARLVLNDRSADALRGAAEPLGAASLAGDVADEAAVRALGDLAIRTYGRIDIWVNNAGIWTPHVSVEEQDPARMHAMMEVNFFGTFYGSRTAVAAMRKQGSGTIVNILSIRVIDNHAGCSGYTASKAAADGFTKTLRLEVAPAGIAVVGVYSERIQTNLFEGETQADYDTYMKPSFVAGRIVENLKRDVPESDLIIRRS